MPNSLRLSLALLTLAVATSAFAQTEAQKAFTTVKSMPGTWEGKASDGRTVQVIYRVTAGGSPVMSEVHSDSEMVSMFHLDGPDKLLMTHYCSAGNEPLMQASASPDGKTITFNYVSATNLATPDAAHMQSLVLTVLDQNHHTEEWTFNDHGKELKQVFDLRRKM